MGPALFVAFAFSVSGLGATSTVTHVGTGTDGIEYPARLARGPAGGLYVTDPPENRVVQFDAAGDQVNTFTIPQGPVGIAAHPDGRVFISRNDGVIGVYSAAFALLSTVNPAPQALVGPNDMAFDPGALELYVVDAEANRVLVFKEVAPPNWTLVRFWGTLGSGNGQFVTPQAIALDTALGHVIVTDTDNFSVQVFNPLGVSVPPMKFGYRTLYTATSDLAWFARSEGVAVDSCGNIYVVDAVMGTVRVFSPTGAELSATHVPAISYGVNPGTLRVPCDIEIVNDKLFVASTNNGVIEVFDVSCATVAAATTEVDKRPESSLLKSGLRAVGIREALIGEAPMGPPPPDNPMMIVDALHAGEFVEELDLNQDRVIDRLDLQLAVDAFGAGTVDDFLYNDGGVATHPAVNPPHILDIDNRCGRCHSMSGAPGGMLTAMGQENLCQSCHSAGKIAGKDWIAPGDLSLSHPWNVLAADADPGPAPGSEVALHLDAGKVRCGTCHEPHESAAGECVVPSPLPNWGFPSYIGSCVGGNANGDPCQKDSQCEQAFIRTGERAFTLCGECHVEYEQWLLAGHGDELADPWSHYDWSMGNNWLCTGPGTPYAYCTGEGTGTALSSAAAACTGAGTPLACCTGPGAGSTCTIANASCLGAGNPWACCSGAGTGNCANNLSAAACTGAGTPMACCTGVGTGSCSSRESCRQCHSGNGYIDFSENFPTGECAGGVNVGKSCTVNADCPSSTCFVLSGTHRGTFRMMDCLTCHATHGKSEDEALLRIYDEVRYPTGQLITGLGPGATCEACHNGRTIPPSPNPAGVSTPHYLNGGAMLEGINAVTTFPTGTGAVTYLLSNSNHSTNLGVDCTTCHMAPTPTAGPGAGRVGGHTFNLKIHDPDDPDFGFENVGNACGTAACHPGLTTFNRTANGDYDGDTTIEGIQDETRGLMAVLLNALYEAGASRLLVDDNGNPVSEAAACTGVGTPLACCTGLHTGPTCDDPHAHGENPYWTTRRCSGGTRNGLACNGTGAGNAPFNCPSGACNATVPTGDVLATVEDAIFNWEFVDNSGDFGVKNTGYAIGLLQIAYKGVTGNPVPNAQYRYSPAP